MNEDPVVEAVREDLLRRSEVKYGRTDLGLRDWLQHAYEETLDLANYLKRCMMTLDTDKSFLAQEIKGWIEAMQPNDLRNRTTGELQDELQRRCEHHLACPHGYIDWDDCPDCRH